MSVRLKVKFKLIFCTKPFILFINFKQIKSEQILINVYKHIFKITASTLNFISVLHFVSNLFLSQNIKNSDNFVILPFSFHITLTYDKMPYGEIKQKKHSFRSRILTKHWYSKILMLQERLVLFVNIFSCMYTNI